MSNEDSRMCLMRATPALRTSKSPANRLLTSAMRTPAWMLETCCPSAAFFSYLRCATFRRRMRDMSDTALYL